MGGMKSIYKTVKKNRVAQSKMDLGKRIVRKITIDIAHGDQNDLQEK